MSGGGLRQVVLRATLILLSGVGISWARADVTKRFSKLRAGSDQYALPPPEQLPLFSLGHRAAVADLIYAHSLVGYGLQFREKQKWVPLARYLRATLALDAKFREPYLYADTLLTMSPVAPTRQDYDNARAIMLRGLDEFPFDQQLWVTTGQYLAYLAPPHLKPPELAARWRAEGARVLGRACEMIGGDDPVPFHCIAAARRLNQGGQRDALIRMLTRTLAVNEDPDVRAQAEAALRKWIGEREANRVKDRERRFGQLWARQLPGAPKDQLLLLGPKVAPFLCAGQVLSGECALSWEAWGQDQ